MEGCVAQIKGVLLNAWTQFLKSRYGAERFDEAVKNVAGADRIQFAAGFLDSSWYPFEAQRPLNELTRLLVTLEDGNVAFDLGRFMADYAFSKVYKNLLSKEGHKLVRNLWLEDSFFQGLRKAESTMPSDNSCLLRYYYEPGMKPSAKLCATTIGFCVRQVEYAGGTDIKVVHPPDKCAARGNDCCEVLIEW